jgi:hypothetical protein
MTTIHEVKGEENGNVRGYKHAKLIRTVYHVGGVKGILRHRMLKMKVVVAMRTAAGMSQRTWETVRAVNKQPVESSMRVASEYRGYARNRRLLICCKGHRRLQCSSFDSTRVTGRSAFRRASMNVVNTSSALLLPGYMSSCNSGKSSRGCSPSSNRRQRESSPTSPG